MGGIRNVSTNTSNQSTGKKKSPDKQENAKKNGNTSQTKNQDVFESKKASAKNADKPKVNGKKNEAAAMETGHGAHAGHTAPVKNDGVIASSSESFLKAGNATTGTNSTQQNQSMGSMPGMDHSGHGNMVGTAMGQTIPSIFEPPKELLNDPTSRQTAEQLGPFFDNIAPIMGYKQDDLQKYDQRLGITHQAVPANSTQSAQWNQEVQKQFNDLYLPVHGDYAHNYGPTWMDGTVHPEWARIETALNNTGIRYQPPAVAPAPQQVQVQTPASQPQATIQEVSHGEHHSH